MKKSSPELLVFNPVASTEEEQSETGEKKLAELQVELKRLEKAVEGRQLFEIIKAKYMSELDLEVKEADSGYYRNIDPQGIAVQLRELLLPKIYGDLFELFGGQNAEALKHVNSQDISSEQDIQGVTEALAAILISDASDEGGHEGSAELSSNTNRVF